MLNCDKTITLIRHIEQLDSDSYEVYVMTDVGYTMQTKFEQNGTAVSGADMLTVTIPQDNCSEVPKKDDYIVCGVLPEPPESLKQLMSCELPCYHVTAVDDYTGGILGHWEVIGS